MHIHLRLNPVFFDFRHSILLKVKLFGLLTYLRDQFVAKVTWISFFERDLSEMNSIIVKFLLRPFDLLEGSYFRLHRLRQLELVVEELFF